MGLSRHGRSGGLDPPGGELESGRERLGLWKRPAASVSACAGPVFSHGVVDIVRRPN